MSAERKKTSDSRKKSHRRRPCVNHPKKAATVRCEVCGNPICPECAQYYDGAHICGEGCWGAAISKQRGEISAKRRQRRKKRGKNADAAVSAGMWIVALLLLAAVGTFIFTMMADHAGEKLWEFSVPGFTLGYSVQQDMSTAYCPSGKGKVAAIDVLTGQERWSVKLPEGISASHLEGLDDHRCLVSSGNRVLLCASTRKTPLWEITAPLPAFHTDPFVFGDSVYMASGQPSYYSSYSSTYESPFSLLSSASSAPERIEGEDEKKDSVIILAGEMTSGAIRWQTEMEDIRVGGLLADEERLFVAGSRPFSYTYTSSPLYEEPGDEDDPEDAGDEEQMGKTQLWALNAGTGEPEWKLEGTGSFHASPMMSDHGIVFSTRENIYLVSPDGKIEWEYPLDDKYIYAIKPHYDKLLVTTNQGFLLCLDLASGQKRWMTEIGVGSDKIVPAVQQVCVSGLVSVDRTPRKVTPTKRWKGSEDLLKSALKKRGSKMEPAVFGLDLETGEVLWSISKIEGDFEHASGVLYALRHWTKYLFYDGNADPGDISKTVTTIGAYDCMTGERLWETTMDGYASDLQLAQGAALAVTSSETFSLSVGGDRPPARLLAISLY